MMRQLLSLTVVLVAGMGPVDASLALNRPASFVSMYAKAKSSLMSENPLTKVVKLMDELKAECEANVKHEQDLFDGFECWYKSVVSQKKASNTEAEERIAALESYIEDIKAGKIEFSTEGADLTKEVKELEGEIAKSAALRKADNEDFLLAKDEMKSAIAALKGAVGEMEAGTEGAAMLEKAAALGRTLLAPKDAALLEQAAKGPDYKKMNRKKTFNLKYKARSGKIQELLKDMLQTFTDNLEEAEDKEKDAKSSYDKLKESKDEELASAKQALDEMGGETAAREEATAEADAEIQTLKDQIDTDNGFIDDTTKNYEDQFKAWMARKKLMQEEITAISNAIAILKSDEARDVSSKTFDKDKVFNSAMLLQVASRHTRGAIKETASGLRAFAKANLAEGSRLDLAAARMLKMDAFGEVFKLLNNIKKDLMKESQDDLDKSKKCTEDLNKKTATAQASSNLIDEKNREINRTEFAVADCWAQVNKTVEEVEEMEWSLNDATIEREKYHEAFVEEKTANLAAADFIKQAQEAMAKFYDDNGLALVQFHFRRAQAARGGSRAPFVEAGKAPPPPPATSIEEYKGSAGNKGIQALLAGIEADVKTDVEELEATEKENQEAFDKMKEDTEKSISDKLDFKTELESQIADHLGTISTLTSEKLSEKETLNAVVKSLKTMEPECDFVFTTREVRIRNRKLEAQGVDTALEKLDGDPKEVEFKEAEE